MKKLRRTYGPKARLDAIQLYEYYLRSADDRTAKRFLMEVRSVLGRLAKFPGLGELIEGSERLAGVRRTRLSSQFRSILIIYREADDRLEVIRILHAQRDLDSALEDE